MKTLKMKIITRKNEVPISRDQGKTLDQKAKTLSIVVIKLLKSINLHLKSTRVRRKINCKNH